MKKITLFLVFVLILTASCGILCFADVPDTSYQLLFNDEFEGDALDTTKWGYRTGGTNRNENIRVANGKLLIDYKKIDDNKTANSYTGGGVITKETFPYGYYETKAKVFTGVKGLHTSFWTSTHRSNAPYYPQQNHLMEIDGFEFNSRADGTAPSPAYNLHYWWPAEHTSYGGKYYSNDTDGDTTTNDEFVMGFEVLPGEIIFYCNGQEVGRIDSAVYSPESVWLTALAYHAVKSPDEIDDSKADENGLFGSSEYDYFRYYQKKLKGVNLLANSHFEFNRQTTTSIPRSFYYTGAVQVCKTPFAYNGFCMASLSGVSTLGRNFSYLLEGPYTFEGYFKTMDNAKARLVVYDKNNVELKSVAIPACNEWTKISLTDIWVEDSAYVVVENSAGLCLADDLAFYCQEGETGYEDYRDADYESYAVLPSSEISSIILSASEATKSENTWTSSSAGGQSNLYGKVSTSNYQNAYATWTYTFEKAGTYDLKGYQIIWENNVPNQNYTVTLDGTTLLDAKSVTTKSGSTQSGAWADLCTIIAEAGQTMTVTLKPGAPERSLVDALLGREASAFMRISPIRILSHDDMLMDTAIAAQTNNPIFLKQGNPYAFDQSDIHFTPYAAYGEIYIPYQAIKDAVPVPGVSDTASHVTVTQIKELSAFNVASQNGYIVIYEKQYTASDTFVPTVKQNLSYLQDPMLYTKRDAVYVDKNDAPYQQVHMTDVATLEGNWGNSTLGYDSLSKYTGNTSATATWSVTPEFPGKYSVQIYNIHHQGNASAGPSTTSAGVHLPLQGTIYTYSLDQYNGPTGWYDLGTFDLTTDPIDLFLFNAAGAGILRANAVRLVPDVKSLTASNATDTLFCLSYTQNDAVKVGDWTKLDQDYAGCIATDALDASLTWDITAKDTAIYAIEIYLPKFGDNATERAAVDLKINGQTTRYLANLKADSAQSNGAGWYTLGQFSLRPSDTVSVTLSNLNSSGRLLAKELRILPLNLKPIQIADFDEPNQEKYSFENAKTTGEWKSSGGAQLAGCYYGGGDATATWNITPTKAQKYSVQAYIPFMAQSSTTQYGYVKLTVDGKSHTFTIDQQKDPNVYMGWYDLGVLDLSPQSKVTIEMGKTSGTYIRAKAVRLIPYPGSVTTVKSGTTVTAKIGTLYRYHDSFLFAEYDSNGILQSVTSHDTAPTVDLTLSDTNNKYELFFWNDNFKPAVQNAGNR